MPGSGEPRRARHEGPSAPPPAPPDRARTRRLALQLLVCDGLATRRRQRRDWLLPSERKSSVHDDQHAAPARHSTGEAQDCPDTCHRWFDRQIASTARDATRANILLQTVVQAGRRPSRTAHFPPPGKVVRRLVGYVVAREAVAGKDMLISLNQFRRRHHQRLAALLLALTLCWLVFAAHSALSERHMGDDMAACLAIAQTAALALALVIVATTRAKVPGPTWARTSNQSPPTRSRPTPVPRSRAGPAVLQVFRC